MAAAVPLPLAVLEATVPLADAASDLESDFTVLDAASEDLVGDALEVVEEESACYVNHLPRRPPLDTTTETLTTLRTILPP